MKLYKSDISYFSGKVEAFLHVKGLEHDLADANYFAMQRIRRHTGVMKMPAIELTEGGWLNDSSWMMRWLEDQHPTPPVRLDDPGEEFVASLLEDYGDEWLWRPAMWWRWVPPLSQRQLGRKIARQFFGPVLNGLVGAWFAWRQRREWLYADGVTRRSDGWVRQLYLDELSSLQSVFERRPFVLGHRPTWADFGYFGPMFRHFGNDPEPAEVMRREAPAVYEWLARVWNGDAGEASGPFDASGLDAVFERIRGDYLPYLEANASAFAEGRARFDLESSTASLRGTVTTTYRVHAWNALIAAWSALEPAAKARVQAIAGELGVLSDGQRVECGLPDEPSLPISFARPFPFRIRHALGQPRN